MNDWISPLTDVAILFALGALGGLGAMFSLGKPISVSLVCESIFKNGSWGAGVGIFAAIKLGKAVAAGCSLLVGAGMVSKQEIGQYLKRMVGIDDSRNPPQP